MKLIAHIDKVITIEFSSFSWSILGKSRSEMLFKTVILKKFANFTEKHLFWTLKTWNFIKNRLQLRCFPVKIAKLLITPILKNICEQLFLRILQEELLNSTSRTLYFNECLWAFQIFYSWQYIPVWYTPTIHEQCNI